MSSMTVPIALGVKIRLGHRECILLDDVVSHCLPASMQDSILISHAEQLFFYCSALAFHQLRKAEPQTPIYGFWQLLHASGLLKQQHELLVVYLSSKRGKFLYRAASGGLCLSGEVRNAKPLIGHGINLPDFNTAAVSHLKDISLRLPQTPILTLAERRQAQHELNKHRLVGALISVGFFFVGFFSLHSYLSEQRAERQDVYDEVQKQVDYLRRQQSDSVSAAKESWPWQWPAVEMIYRLADVDERLDVWSIDFSQELFEASIKPISALPGYIIRDLDEIRYRQDGTVIVRWSRPS